jgi:hypothetical protein
MSDRKIDPRISQESHISGSAQGPLTIASAPVDLTALSDVCFSETSQDPLFNILSCEFTA